MSTLTSDMTPGPGSTTYNTQQPWAGLALMDSTRKDSVAQATRTFQVQQGVTHL